MPASQLLDTHKARPNSVEKELECGEKRFPQYVVQEHHFNFGRNICVDPVLAQMLVMFNMVWLESHSKRHSRREVCEDCQDPIRCDTFECKVVGNLMNCKKNMLVRCTANQVCC